MIEPTPRLHTPSWERMDLPDGFAACLACHEIFTVEELLDPCATQPPEEPAP